MFNMYPEPTQKQTELVKRLYQFQQKVLKSTSKEQLNEIVINILAIIEGVPTAEIHLRDGRIFNSDVAKQQITEVLKLDVQSYEHLKDAQTGMFLTIELMIGVFILDSSKRPV